MTIKVTVEFNTIAEAVAFLAPAAAASIVPQAATEPLQSPKPRIRSKPATATPVESLPLPLPVAEAPVPIAAALKVPNQPVQAIPAPTPVAAAPTPAPVAATVVSDSGQQQATAEGVRLALREVFNKRGAKTATELLKSFGAASISQIKPEQYAGFVAKAAAQ